MPRDGLLFTELIREISVGDPFGYYVGSAFMNTHPNESYHIRVANSSEEQIKLKLGQKGNFVLESRYLPSQILCILLGIVCHEKIFDCYIHPQIIPFKQSAKGTLHLLTLIFAVGE